MKFKTALVLGGGGVRGFAHIGVLKVLEREKFPIDLIVGTSIGAIVGAGFALQRDVGRLERLANFAIESEELKEIESFFSAQWVGIERKMFNWFDEILRDLNLLRRLKNKWIFEAEKIGKLISSLIPEDASFADLEIPFICLAADIFSGEKVILKEGNLLSAVLASSSIPGVFPPQKLDNRFLVDGGIVSKLPVEEAKSLGAKFILGVNVERPLPSGELRDGIDIILRVNAILSYWLNIYNIREADFLIVPDLKNLDWASFSQGKWCIERGEEETERILPQLKRAWRKGKLRNYLKVFSAMRVK